MQSKKTFTIPVIGGSSLLVIFAVLCLTIFTLLALSNAQANARLTEASVEAVSAYYEADLQAEILFAQLRQGLLPEEVEVTDNIYTYSCTISDTQTLMVTLEKTGNSWNVLQWQMIHTSKESP